MLKCIILMLLQSSAKLIMIYIYVYASQAVTQIDQADQSMIFSCCKSWRPQKEDWPCVELGQCERVIGLIIDTSDKENLANNLPYSRSIAALRFLKSEVLRGECHEHFIFDHS